MIMSQENFDDLVKSRFGSDEFWKTSFHPIMARMIFWRKLTFGKKVSFALTKVFLKKRAFRQMLLNAKANATVFIGEKETNFWLRKFV